jgi:hypothetical protein
MKICILPVSARFYKHGLKNDFSQKQAAISERVGTVATRLMLIQEVLCLDPGVRLNTDSGFLWISLLQPDKCEDVSKSFRTESVTKYSFTFGTTR